MAANENRNLDSHNITKSKKETSALGTCTSEGKEQETPKNISKYSQKHSEDKQRRTPLQDKTNQENAQQTEKRKKGNKSTIPNSITDSVDYQSENADANSTVQTTDALFTEVTPKESSILAYTGTEIEPDAHTTESISGYTGASVEEERKCIYKWIKELLFRCMNYTMAVSQRAIVLVRSYNARPLYISFLLIFSMYCVRALTMDSFRRISGECYDGICYSSIPIYIQTLDFFLSLVTCIYIGGILLQAGAREISNYLILITHLVFILGSVWALHLDKYILKRIDIVLGSTYDVAGILIINSVFGYVSRRRMLIYQSIVGFSVNYAIFIYISYYFWAIIKNTSKFTLHSLAKHVNSPNSMAAKKEKEAHMRALSNSYYKRTAMQVIKKYIFLISIYKIAICISTALFFMCYKVILKIKTRNPVMESIQERTYNSRRVKTMGILLSIEFIRTSVWCILLNILLLTIKKALETV
ncbi:hypothetical protein NEPAR06_0211 [Nematocida parisii]|uniref:uncharacterized protein n=1 Tax=Nematocida parisii (strain ERTm1 / ATCC PRA-289) TaxID=881290 RepID=UPI000264B9BC|nr:uncharacterized protein NEPG_00609 [Nematocida parisii ERTm1]KAI5126602.1 hypothetical protein NEPAR08_0521 [Nematocida parisii]EIJ95084.1 hypothetical protein NEPG_00609 [Nematocida parisii ERTm1]KAI5127885.1 hypothetical protein NEPAR03_1165 [Nematocida parisii]KAI5143176.1 hypothetical protein NEPAR07_0538 [Nematocida parisii]KAI5153133.1 hypothetical protein NEPAR06_0211 [Nematocida parisii]|eukprot:XP_013058440.1 hypothetical protein NEPG_00609 [Nematocida parisii ERTm1]